MALWSKAAAGQLILSLVAWPQSRCSSNSFTSWLVIATFVAGCWGVNRKHATGPCTTRSDARCSRGDARASLPPPTAPVVARLQSDVCTTTRVCRYTRHLEAPSDRVQKSSLPTNRGGDSHVGVTCSGFELTKATPRSWRIGLWRASAPLVSACAWDSSCPPGTMGGSASLKCVRSTSGLRLFAGSRPRFSTRRRDCLWLPRGAEPETRWRCTVASLRESRGQHDGPAG